jgi:hypothetical protein
VALVIFITISLLVRDCEHTIESLSPQRIKKANRVVMTSFSDLFEVTVEFSDPKLV